MQMVLSPLDFTSIGPPWTSSAKVFDFFSTGVDPVDMPLSTAVGLERPLSLDLAGGLVRLRRSQREEPRARRRASAA